MCNFCLQWLKFSIANLKVDIVYMYVAETAVRRVKTSASVGPSLFCQAGVQFAPNFCFPVFLLSVSMGPYGGENLNTLSDFNLTS